MDVNTEAAGSAGLATATAEEGVGETAEPLDDLRAIFTTLGMIINQLDGMINAHNLTNMDNFDYIRVEDAKSFAKVCNNTSREVATKVVIPPQRKLQGFFYCYHDQRKRGLIPAAADFDVTTLMLAVNKFDAEKTGKGLISNTWIQVR